MVYNNEELIKLARNGDKDAEEKLFLENDKLCYYIAKKFNNTQLDLDDLASMARIGLLKAYKAFDSSKNFKFTTFSIRLMYNEILMFLRSNKKHKSNISLETPIAIDKDGNDLTLIEVTPMEESEFKFEDYEMLKEALLIFQKTEKEIHFEILKQCTMLGRTQRDVSIELGLSQSYVSRIEGRAKNKLRKIAFEISDIKNSVVNNVVDHGNTKYDKAIFVYIFENYAYLKVKEIAEIVECSRKIVTKAKQEYRDGLLCNIEPKISKELAKKIYNFIASQQNKNFKSEKKVVNQ